MAQLGHTDPKAKLRCEVRRMRLLSFSRRPLVRGRRIAARTDRGEDAVALAADGARELDEGFEL